MVRPKDLVENERVHNFDAISAAVEDSFRRQGVIESKTFVERAIPRANAPIRKPTDGVAVEMSKRVAQVVLLDSTQITKIKVWEETKGSRGGAPPKNELVLINYDAEKLLAKFDEVSDEE